MTEFITRKLIVDSKKGLLKNFKFFEQMLENGRRVFVKEDLFPLTSQQQEALTCFLEKPAISNDLLDYCPESIIVLGVHVSPEDYSLTPSAGCVDAKIS